MKVNQAELKRVEEKFGGLLETAPDAMMIVNDRGQIILVNARTERLFGYKREDFLGQPIEFLIPKRFRSQHVQHFARHFADPETRLIGTDLELYALHRDGRQFPVEISLSPLKTENGILISAAVRDISERKKVEEVLREAKETLEKHVRERTVALVAANEKLQAEIAERKRAEVTLKVRARQQAAIAQLGQSALANVDLAAILDEGIDLVTEILEVPYAMVLKFLPDTNVMLLRAGVGWKAGLVGQATVNAGSHTQVGYTLVSTKSAVVEDFGTETRFQAPPILQEHGVVSGISVVVPGSERPFGILGAYSDKRRTFTEDDVHFVQAVANVIAQTIERERRQHYLTLLNDITRAAASTLDFNVMLQTLADRLSELLNADGCYITLWDEVHQMARVGAVSGPSTEKHGGPVSDFVETRLTEFLLRIGDALVLGDTLNLAHSTSPLTRHFPDHLFLGLPLIAGKQKLGAAFVAFKRPHYFTPTEIADSEQAAGQIALAVSKAQVLATEREQRELAETLREVVAALNSTLAREEVLELILEQLARVVAYDSAAVMLLLPDNTLETVTRRSAQIESPFTTSLRVETLEHVQEVLETYKAVIIADTTADDRWRQLPHTAYIRCWLGVPLVVHDRIIGLLNLSKGEPGFYTGRDARVAMTFANQAAVAIENARLYDRLRVHAAELEQRVQERTRELTEANEQLQELDRLKSRFISDVSHELRTPVTTLGLYVSLLQKGRPEKREHYLTVLQEQVDRLGQIIESVLTLSRIELGRERVEFAPIDLNDLVQQMVIAYRPRAQASDLTLHFEPAQDLTPIPAAQGQLVELVTHLLINAIQYTPEGHICVRTALTADGRYVCLEVQDTGIGIEPEDLPHIFERFYRGQRVSQLNIPGPGLGLSIAKEIVSLHSGRLEVQSEVGAGSTFQLYFPVNGQSP